ncbi:GlsB/YeaQ/YmgE family stress response membrane protein [Couchioplanes caeruleus]|uniref:GlsB/YeaQ/YmgE family stress response membrane protein n=1 Tax=Couchioplanes caeruleus TaxID=56438 RepID=UPI0020BE2CF0|nr:GlsB/YeaQ/YmgE family stress response membrane protein [Couchioplanes caeruleus]UQU62643.1 GlsB/YeaQ/YmgE family stress response membrane protein [Couchioplanes caeruleus]
MTTSSLVTALAIGLAVGLSARWIPPRHHDTPWWLPVAVAVAAAMLATVVTHLTGARTTGVGATEVLLQVLFAATAVTLVAMTTDRRGKDPGHHRTSRPR